MKKLKKQEVLRVFNSVWIAGCKSISFMKKSDDESIKIGNVGNEIRDLINDFHVDDDTEVLDPDLIYNEDAKP